LLSLSPVIKGIILAIAGFALLSAGDACAKILAEDNSIFEISWFFALTGLFVLAAASPWLGGIRKSVFTPKWKLQLFRATLGLGITLLAIYGFSQLSMAKVYTLFFCAPFFTSIISIPLLKEHVGLHRWLAIIAGFSGVLIALRPGVIPLDMASTGILIAAMLFSIVNLMVRIIGGDETPLSFSLYPMILRTLVLAPAVMFPFIDIPGPGELALYLFGGLCMSLGIVCMAMGFRYAPASVAAPFHYTQMIWGILLGYYIFGDMPDIWTLAGAAIVIASGLYLIHRENRTASRIVTKQGEVLVGEQPHT
jgi:drug/metabolite transporter (DMT)-like permease